MTRLPSYFKSNTWTTLPKNKAVPTTPATNYVLCSGLASIGSQILIQSLIFMQRGGLVGGG